MTRSKFLFSSSYIVIFVMSVFLQSYYTSNLKSESSIYPIIHLRDDGFPGGGVWDKAYMIRPQKLSQGRLNLNPWGGFHELKLDKNFKRNTFKVSFDLSPSENSYIHIYLDRSDESKSMGIRIS